jgi:hypothetical protein
MLAKEVGLFLGELRNKGVRATNSIIMIANKTHGRCGVEDTITPSGKSQGAA